MGRDLMMNRWIIFDGGREGRERRSWLVHLERQETNNSGNN
jgi:hypothetical protein